MKPHDKEEELYRGDELPVPFAFPLDNDLARDNLTNDTTAADMHELGSDPDALDEP